MPSMRIELISEDIYSFAEVISEYETSVLTVKLRGRIQAVLSSIRGACSCARGYIICTATILHSTSRIESLTPDWNHIQIVNHEHSLFIYLDGEYLRITVECHALDITRLDLYTIWVCLHTSQCFAT